MRPDELDSAVSVWREANVARGAPHGRERTDRVRAKLSASRPWHSWHCDRASWAWRWPSRDGSMTARANPTRRSCTSRWCSCIPPHSAQESASPGPSCPRRRRFARISACRRLDRQGQHARPRALRARRDDPHRQERSFSCGNAAPIRMPSQRRDGTRPALAALLRARTAPLRSQGARGRAVASCGTS